MAETKPSKQYGLFVPKKKSVLQERPSIFNDDENDEDEADNVGIKLQKEGIKAVTKKTTQLEMQKALAEDPTVYEYDKVYEAMEQKKQQKQLSVAKDRKPKYIESLLKTADQRKREYERRVERKVQKEREAEGDEFADKEAFVTSAYRKKMEEFQKIEEEERREEIFEGLTDVTKQKDLSGFYRHLLRQKFEENKNQASSSNTEAEEKNNSSPKAESESKTGKTETSKNATTTKSIEEPSLTTVKPKLKEEPLSSSENESAEFNKTKTKSLRNIRKRRSSSSSSGDSRHDRKSKEKRSKRSVSSDKDSHKRRSTEKRKWSPPPRNRNSYSRSLKSDYPRRRYFEKSPDKYKGYRNRSSRERYSPRNAPIRNKARRHSRSSSRSSNERSSRRDNPSRRRRDSSSSDDRGRRGGSRYSSSRSGKTDAKRRPDVDKNKNQQSNPVNVTQNYDRNSNEEESGDEIANKVEHSKADKEEKLNISSDDKKDEEKQTDVGVVPSENEQSLTNSTRSTSSDSKELNLIKLFAKRNTGEALSAARERYLLRKKASAMEFANENVTET